MIAERRSAGHQLVHHGAERPNITGHDGLGLATETLRPHICQGAATLFCSLGSADGAAHSGTDSEIGNQIVALVVKEFYNIDNSKENVELMFLRGEKLNYYENDDLKAVKLDYNIPDNSINAIAILPKSEQYLEQSINDLIENLDDNLFYNIVENLNKESSITKVNLYLPKYELDFDINLNEILKELGMSKAFERDAEFQGINSKLKLFINKILQKNYINVNEKGTQACSASELEIMLESYLTKDETAKDFNANRPFLFFLRNEKLPKGHDIIFFNKICNLKKEIDG